MTTKHALCASSMNKATELGDMCAGALAMGDDDIALELLEKVVKHYTKICELKRKDIYKE